MARNSSTLISCAIITFAWTLASSASAHWTIVDLGTLDGRYSYAADINNSRQVVGHATYVGGGPWDYHVVLWDAAGNKTDLGSLGGGYLAQSEGINAAGQIAGWSKTPPYPNIHPFISSNGTLIDLGTAGGSQAYAMDINTQGWLAGTDNESGAFYWDGTTNISLNNPAPAGWTRLFEANGINDAGKIVGAGRTTSQLNRPFIYDMASASAVDLGSLGPGDSQGIATAISNSGFVVGWCETGGMFGSDHLEVVHAFRWSGGVLSDLGTLANGGYSQAYDVNESGQVVGASTRVAQGEGDPVYAFLWDNGVMTDLNDLLPPSSGWVLREAHGINDQGLIVGFGTYAFKDRAFLLLPPSAVCLECDTNCDGSVNQFDIQPFVNQVADQTPGCSPCAGDFTGDGSVNQFDLQGIVACMLPAHPAPQPSLGVHMPRRPIYAITDIGALPAGNYSNASAVNDLGLVAGYSAGAGGWSHAVIWENGVMTDLGTFTAYAAFARDINNAGQVIGATAFPDLGWMWHNGVTTYLPMSEAYAINNLGAVVGVSGGACLWHNGTLTGLGGLGGGYSRATGITENGKICGTAAIGNGDTHGFIWENGSMTDLGTLGGAMSAAVDINEAGHIVGRSWPVGEGNYQAFLYKDGVMSNIGTLGGDTADALGINNLDQVVGASQLIDGAGRAFIWQNGVMTNLNYLVIDGSEWVLLQAADISDSGQIVGYGKFRGHEHGFVLTPQP